jgi:transcriptional regulator with XRE-family HTH domain
MQIRALRKSRGLSQPELAKLADMAQPRICEIEKPGERKPNVETLLRLANAFDVGLQIRFVPFDQLITDDDDMRLDNLSIKTFDEIVKEAEEEELTRTSKKHNALGMSKSAKRSLSRAAKKRALHNDANRNY